SIAEHTIAQIKSDAQILAVLTANVDVLSRQKRLQGFTDAGKSLLFLAASFIPIVGEVLRPSPSTPSRRSRVTPRSSPCLPQTWTY
ncbi:hypothetical protein ACNQTB_12350, partial [Corynebacterium diphtheriae]